MRLKFPKFSIKRGGKPVRLNFSPRIVKRVGIWTTVMCLAFSVFAWVNIPTRALAWRIVHEANNRGFNVSIERLTLTPIAGINFYDVIWNFPRAAGSDITLPFVIDRLNISASAWSYLLFNQIDVSAEADLDEGRIESDYKRNKESFHISVNATDLPLYNVPRLQQTLNAPLRGTVEFKIDLDVPNHRWERSNGTIDISCSGCSVGDGLTAVNVPGAKGMMAKGITIPEIHLGDLQGRIVVEKGVATIEEMIMVGEDVQLKISGTLQLSEKLQNSKIDLEIRLMVSQKLQDRDDTIRFMVGSAGNSVRLEAPEEGWFGYSWEGTFAKNKLRGLNSKRKADKRRQQRLSRQKQLENIRSGAGRAKVAKPVVPSKSATPSTAVVRPALENSGEHKPAAKGGASNSLDIPGMVPIKPWVPDSDEEEGVEIDDLDDSPESSARGGGPAAPLGAASSVVMPSTQPEKADPTINDESSDNQPEDAEEEDEKEEDEKEEDEKEPEPNQEDDVETNTGNSEDPSETTETVDPGKAANNEESEESTGSEDDSPAGSEGAMPTKPPI